jgi:hypothetical protein
VARATSVTSKQRAPRARGSRRYLVYTKSGRARKKSAKRLATYGTERRRIAPLDQPFANRLLAAVHTPQVAIAPAGGVAEEPTTAGFHSTNVPRYS